MAIPTRREQALNKKGSKYNNKSITMSEKSLYLSMKYDFENNSLPEWKKEEFLKLKNKYEE